MHEAKEQSAFLDRCGIWLSSLCALHCLLLPVMVSLLPLVASSFLAQHWFERFILIGSMCIGAVALSIGVLRHHGNPTPLIALAAGGLIYWFKDVFGHDAEPFMVLIGASLIVFGHVRNIHLTRECCKDVVTASDSVAQATESASGSC